MLLLIAAYAAVGLVAARIIYVWGVDEENDTYSDAAWQGVIGGLTWPVWAAIWVARRTLFRPTKKQLKAEQDKEYEDALKVLNGEPPAKRRSRDKSWANDALKNPHWTSRIDCRDSDGVHWCFNDLPCEAYGKGLY